MRKNRKICFAMLLLVMHMVLTGCMPSNVRVQTNDRQFVPVNKTNLVAGLKKIEDKRPENEKESDQYYEKSNAITANEKLYRDLKLSGLFNEILFEKFDNNNVDVILDPCVNHFYYETQSNGWTAFNLLFAITGLPGLIYQLAGGPNGEHYGEASLELKMINTEGNVLATGSGEKKLSTSSNLHNRETEGIGIIEGKALSDASHDTLLSLSTNIKFDQLPASKFIKTSTCGSDKDCKGDRICVDGKCVSPNSEKNIQGARLESMGQQ